MMSIGCTDHDLSAGRGAGSRLFRLLLPWAGLGLCLTIALAPARTQSWWMGPSAEVGALRSFSLTGLQTEDETTVAGGLGGVITNRKWFAIPEFATDGEAHVGGLSAGAMFWDRFGIGLKANLLFDRFQTVVQDPAGNPIPPLDNRQSYFLAGGQLLFFTAPSGEGRRRSPVISLGFSTAGNGLFWGHLGLGYTWQVARPEK